MTVSPVHISKQDVDSDKRSSLLQTTASPHITWQSESYKNTIKPIISTVRNALTTVKWHSLISDTPRNLLIPSPHTPSTVIDAYVEQYDLCLTEFTRTHTRSNGRQQSFDCCVVGINQDVAERAAQAGESSSQVQRDKIWGELLGYPECCVQSFTESNNSPHPDLVQKYITACNTPSSIRMSGDPESIKLTNPSPYLNNFYELHTSTDEMWPLGFLFHRPCTYECERSIQIGKRTEDILRATGHGSLADVMLDLFNQPLRWETVHGLTTIKSKHLTAVHSDLFAWNAKEIHWNPE